MIPVSVIGATQDSDAWIAKGNAIADLGKYDKAIKAYEKAKEIGYLYAMNRSKMIQKATIIA